MSYNTTTSAKNIIGVDVTQEQLDVAQSYIHNYSRYRWEATVETLRFSSDRGFPGRIFLNMPITTFTYLKSVDQSTTPETLTTLTRYTDYDVDERTGLLFFTDQYTGSYNFDAEVNNFEAQYTYGYTNTDVNYNKVLLAEAQIALMINKNPLMMTEVNLSDDTAKFAIDPIEKILQQAVPKRIRIMGIGGVGKEATINNMWNRQHYNNGGWTCY